ncbi:MAG: MBL fold metallo-hydrolase [Calditerrivibrio sp.]|nr:MBL fold metallo-hydrolase [Calditerrivibrio sp.]
MDFAVIPSGPLQVNCIIIYKDKYALIFDPGGSFEKIDEFLSSKNLIPVMILNTHGHFDHIGAVKELKDRYSVKFAMSKKDEFLVNQASAHASYFGLPSVASPEIDIDLNGDVVLNNIVTDIEIISTPGHTPGGLSFFVKSLNLLITGDTLFAGSVGRTDFPYSSFRLLEISVKKLYNLADDVMVIPGHGELTTIGDEKKYNPFIKG